MAFKDIIESVRKTMGIFFLIDTSGSMSGSKIGVVNSSMEELGPMLRELSDDNDDAEIVVATLEFSDGCHWLYDSTKPISVEDFTWSDLDASGLTSMGAAFTELNGKLSRDEFLASDAGCFAPVVILLSDGVPTDNWEQPLDQLKKNGWFKHAIKIAISIDHKDNLDVLEAFTGNEEAVLLAQDKTTLKKMIHKVAIKSSEIQSQSSPVTKNDLTAEQDAVKVVQETKKEIDDEVTVDTGNTALWEGF